MGWPSPHSSVSRATNRPIACGGRSSRASDCPNGHSLVVLADCSIRRQHVVALDLRPDARRAFATLSSPEALRGYGQATANRDGD
jgi:hypothetical protein